MALNCGYGIIWDIPNNPDGSTKYEITLEGETIYKGRIYFKNDTDSESVDLAPIFREYLDTLYNEIEFGAGTIELPANGLYSSYHTFTVTPENGASTTFDVVYNYNSNYELESDGNTIMNYPVLLHVDPRQYLFLSGLTGANLSYTTSKGGSGSGSPSGTGINLFTIDLKTLNLEVGDTITLSANGNEYEYNILSYCRNRYALYYVNEYGGLDSLLCLPNTVDTYTGDNIEVRLQNDNNYRQDFHQQRLQTLVHKRYNVITGYIDDDGARNIQHLIYSPKVFIHNLDENTITSCIVTNTSITTGLKRFNGNRFTYSFTVEESQLYLRK